MSDIHSFLQRCFCAASLAFIVSSLAMSLAFGASPKVGVPLDLVLSIDSSGSMGPMPPGEDPKNAKYYGKDLRGMRIAASKQVARNLDQNLVWIGLVSWDDSVDRTVPVSNDRRQLTRALDFIDSDGGTDLDLGLRTALSLLDRSPRPDARKVVIFLTDGVSTDGISQGTIQRAQRRDVKVYTIGLEVPPEARQPLVTAAEATGGRFFTAPDAVALQRIFETIIGDVTDFYLALDMADGGKAGQNVAFEARLVDRSRKALVALDDIPLEIGVERPEATSRQLRRHELDHREVSFQPGDIVAAGDLSVGEEPGLIVVAATVPGLGVSARRVLAVTRPDDRGELEEGRFELVVGEPSVLVGRPLAVKVVHLDRLGYPSPAVRDHELVLNISPKNLSELANRQFATLPIRTPEIIGTAFAQESVRSLEVEADDFVELENAIFKIRAVFKQGSVAFSFSVFAMEPLLFEMSLEIDGQRIDKKDLLGFAEHFGTIDRKDGGLLVWGSPGEIAANGAAEASIRVLAAFKRGDTADLVLTCLPPLEDGARTLQPNATRGGTLLPPQVEPLSSGCNAIIEDRISLRASHTPGLSVIETMIYDVPDQESNGGSAQPREVLFGHGGIVFLAVAPLLQLLAACFGGVLGAALREYQKIDEDEQVQVTLQALIGPFLVMGAAVGPIFYGAIYSLLPLLPWAPGIAVNVVLAAVLGAMAGYVGPRIMDVLRDLIFRKLGGRVGS